MATADVWPVKGIRLMAKPASIWGKIHRATWAPFLVLVAMLPLMNMQTADFQMMFVQAVGLLLSAGLLFFATHRIRLLVKEAESMFGQHGDE